MIKIILVFFLFHSISFGQTPDIADDKPVDEYSDTDFEVLKAQRLSRIHTELVIIRNKIKSLNKENEKSSDMLSRIQFDSKIEKLEKENQ